MIRVILSDMRTHGSRSPSFLARWNGVELCRSSQPLLESPRVLEGMGYGFETMTARHEGKSFDSFKPAKVGDLAKLTIKERAIGFEMAKWMPLPAHRTRRGEPLAGEVGSK